MGEKDVRKAAEEKAYRLWRKRKITLWVALFMLAVFLAIMIVGRAWRSYNYLSRRFGRHEARAGKRIRGTTHGAVTKPLRRFDTALKGPRTKGDLVLGYIPTEWKGAGDLLVVADLAKCHEALGRVWPAKIFVSSGYVVIWAGFGSRGETRMLVGTLAGPPQQVVRWKAEMDKAEDVTPGVCGKSLHCYQVANGKRGYLYVAFRPKQGMAFMAQDPDRLEKVVNGGFDPSRARIWRDRLAFLGRGWALGVLGHFSRTGEEVGGFKPVQESLGQVERVVLEGVGFPAADGLKARATLTLLDSQRRKVRLPVVKAAWELSALRMVPSSFLLAGMDLGSVAKALSLKDKEVGGRGFVSAGFIRGRPAFYVKASGVPSKAFSGALKPFVSKDWADVSGLLPPVVRMFLGEVKVRGDERKRLLEVANFFGPLSPVEGAMKEELAEVLATKPFFFVVFSPRDFTQSIGNFLSQLFPLNPPQRAQLEQAEAQAGLVKAISFWGTSPLEYGVHVKVK